MPTGPTRLTPRQSEVLGLVRLGLPNKEIARRLKISTRTVQAHLGAIYGSMGVRNRTQAAVKAWV